MLASGWEPLCDPNMDVCQGIANHLLITHHAFHTDFRTCLECEQSEGTGNNTAGDFYSAPASCIFRHSL